MLIALLIGIVTVILENKLSVIEAGNLSYMYLVVCGLIMSIGIVIPGVSSTIILMLLGVYSTYLQSIANLYLPVLIPMGIGLITGSFVVMKITKKLLEKHYAKVFYSIIGFTIGSIFVLLPEFNSILEVIVSILCVILGISLSKRMG